MSDRAGNGRFSNRAKARPEAPPPPESPFRRLQARGGQLLHWFPELGKTLLREGEGLESLVGQVQSLRGEIRRRAGATGRDLEARAERLLGDLERQTVERLQPLLTRAHVASQRETEALESRQARLEARIAPLLDERAALATRVVDLERQLAAARTALAGRVSDLEGRLAEARADLGERVRELDMRLAATDDVRSDVVELRGHIDRLAKEHLTRALETGKLHDRVTRMEMRFGDLLKEHGTHLADHEDVKKRLSAFANELADAIRLARGAADDATRATTAAHGSSERLATLGAEHARERTEIEQLGERGLEVERIIRQLDLRLGDLAERHTAAREDLAALAGRMAQLELTSAPPAAASAAVERGEGH